MGQIVGLKAKPKRCNLNKLSQLGTPAAGEYILVSYDNSMTANGQGNFDRYIIGDGRTAATALELKYLDDSTRPYIVEEVNKAVADIQPIEITGDVTNAPDEEDLTSENQGGTDVLKFKDKAYNSALYSGLGRVYLRKNIVTLEGTGKNVLTQAMVNTANTIYHIQYDYDLNGQTINLPTGCVLEFDGGSIRNGIINGDGLSIIASSKVFYNVTGTISNCKSLVHTSWFGFNTSDIQKAVDMFPNSTVFIDSGQYVHDATVTVPYDILLQAGKVSITTAIDAPVLELYIQGLPVTLDTISIFVDTSYTNAAVVLKGTGYSSIRGYNLNYYPTNKKDIRLPYVSRYPGATSDGSSTAYEIITGDDAQEYHYMYWNRIYGSAKGVHVCLRINCNGDAGTITSNEYYITCWWCMTAVSVSENVGGPYYIYYQCNNYSKKIYQNDSYESQRLEGRGPYINLYIVDQHRVSSENISQMIDNPAVMQVDGYNIYRSAKSLFRNSNKTKERNEYRESRLSDAELAYGNIKFSNSSIVEVALRNISSYEDALKYFVEFFNSSNPTRTVNFELNIGPRLTNANNTFTSEFTKICYDGILSHPTNIKIDFILPFYGSYHASLIKYLYYQKTDLTTGSKAYITYTVEYDNDNKVSAITQTYKETTGEVVAEPVLGEHGYVDKGVYYINSLKANLTYSDALKGFVDDNGSLIIQEPTTYDELLSAPFNIVPNKIFKINGGLYYVSQLGRYPEGSIVYNRYPTSGESWTFSFMDETFTITFPQEVFTSYIDLHGYIIREARKQGVNNFEFGDSSSSSFRQYYSLMTHIQLPSKYASNYYGKVVDGDGNIVSQSPYFGEKGSQNAIVPVQQVLSGTFANKPVGTDIYVGFRYFCTDKQTTEGATDGIEIIYKGNDVWVDALGRAVS